MNLLLLKIRELILIIDIPIIPPKVFIIMSVMSETPMCRIYWRASKIKDINTINSIFKNFLSKVLFKYMPSGINKITLMSISLVTLALNGIKLMERIYFKSEIWNLNLKTIIQVSNIKYSMNDTFTMFLSKLVCFFMEILHLKSLSTTKYCSIIISKYI